MTTSEPPPPATRMGNATIRVLLLYSISPAGKLGPFEKMRWLQVDADVEGSLVRAIYWGPDERVPLEDCLLNADDHMGQCRHGDQESGVCRYSTCRRPKPACSSVALRRKNS